MTLPKMPILSFLVPDPYSRILFPFLIFRALDVLLVMSALLVSTFVLTSFYTPEDEKQNKTNASAPDADSSADLHKKFDRFRHKYIAVYLVIMLADWMQGTHMYTLYLSYNVNISALFLTGFLSGAFFAPFLGSAVDKFGRKNSCIVYCVLEIIINCLEHSSDFTVLLIGRVLGGKLHIKVFHYLSESRLSSD